MTRCRHLPIILLLVLASGVSAQPPSGTSKPLVYNDPAESSPNIDRMVKDAMTDKFRFINTTQKTGYTSPDQRN